MVVWAIGGISYGRTESKCHSYLQEQQEGGSREVQTVYLSLILGKVMEHFQICLAKVGDCELSAQIYERKIIPEQKEASIRR